eukprot:s132_g40.t1
MSTTGEKPVGLSAHEFWSIGLKDLLTKEHRPAHLMHLAYQFLDKLPGNFGKAVADASRAETGEAGRPHRAAEARRILPIRVSAAAHYCKRLPEDVSSWVCLLVEALNFAYLGGKRVLGGEILNDAQRSALEMLITSVEDFKEVEVRVPSLSKLKNDLGRVRFDYSGEMVAIMEDLTADSVIACWPGVGEAGIQPAEKFVTDEAKEWLSKPRSTLLPRCYWPDCPPKSRVRASDSEWEKIVRAAVERNMMCEVAEEDILRDGEGRLVLNGAGAVPKYKVINGQEVKLQRFISILVPSNSYQEHMPGDDRHLPYLGQLSMVELGEGQEILIDSEDLTSCFNLFSLPPEWAGMMTFSKQVSSAVFGGSPDQLWTRPTKIFWKDRSLSGTKGSVPPAPCKYGLSLNVGKRLVGAAKGSLQGGVLDGQKGAFYSAPEKQAGLIGYGLMLLSQSKVSEFELRHFAGKALFNLAFRRPAMSLFESIFYDIERLSHSTEARTLAPATKDEIFLVLALTPLLRMNLRAVVDGEVTITDASPLGAGGGVSSSFKRAPDTVEHGGGECFYCQRILTGPKYPCPAECNAVMCSALRGTPSRGQGEAAIPGQWDGPSGAKCASQFDPGEWGADAKLTTCAKIQKALENGDQTPPGNVVLVRDPEIFAELQNIWSAYGCTVGPKMVTMRIIAPSWYRQCCTEPVPADSPAAIIRDLAVNCSQRVCVLTGGNWQSVQHKKGPMLVGHLRLPLDVATAVTAFSGQKAIFLGILPCKHFDPKKVVWIPRKAELNEESYFSYCKEQSIGKKLPLAFRQGGGSDLGLVGGNAMDFPTNTSKQFILQGTPKHWETHYVVKLLNDQKWSQVEVLTRRRGHHGQNGPQWVFKGTPPENSGGVTYWYFADTAGDCAVHMNIFPEGPRKRKVPLAEWVTPLKKRWVDNKRDPPKRDLSIVVPSQETNPNNDEGSGRQRSPRRDAATAASQQAATQAAPARPAPAAQSNQLLRDNPGFEEVDRGGNGDCFFRIAAHWMIFFQKKDIKHDKMATEASKLRLAAVDHVSKHKKEYMPFWAPDPDEPVEYRANQDAPSSFDAYVKVAAKQQYWVDDLLLSALSTRLGCIFVIFCWNETSKVWIRFVQAPKFESGIAVATGKIRDPMIFLLKGKHYTGLCPKDDGFECPQNWLRETRLPSKAELRGGANSSDHESDAASVFSLSLPPATPARSVAASSSRPASLQLPCKTPGRASSVGRGLRRRLCGKQSVPESDALFQPQSLAAGSVAVGSVADPNAIADDEVPEPPAPPKAGGPKTLEESEYVWTCPYCGVVLSAASSKKRTEKRSNHLAKRHKDREITKADANRYFTPLVPVSPYIPEDERSWTCPVCHGGLPGMSKGQKEKSIKHHWDTVHPGMNTPENQAKWRGERSKRIKGLSAKYCASFDAKPKPETEGHVTIRFHPHEDTVKAFRNRRKEARGRSVTCMTCWRVQFRGAWSDSPCPGRVVSPDGEAWTAQSKVWFRLRTQEPGTAFQLAGLWNTSVDTVDNLVLPPKQLADLKRQVLVEQGIEPNPGPLSNQLCVYTCNIRSANGLGPFWILPPPASTKNCVPVLCRKFACRPPKLLRSTEQPRNVGSDVFRLLVLLPATAGVKTVTTGELLG